MLDTVGRIGQTNNMLRLQRGQLLARKVACTSGMPGISHASCRSCLLPAWVVYMPDAVPLCKRCPITSHDSSWLTWGMLQLTMSNIAPKSGRLWLHAVSTWVVSLIAYWVSQPSAVIWTVLPHQITNLQQGRTNT